MNINVNYSTFTTCNAAYSGGQVYMLVAGGGCSNTGEVPGVLEHEWGHGLDATARGGGGDWGEGMADHEDWLTNRDSHEGSGFYAGNRDALREMDEDLAPILRVWPA